MPGRNAKGPRGRHKQSGRFRIRAEKPPEPSATDQVLEWRLNVSPLRRSIRDRRPPNRYGFGINAMPADDNKKRKRGHPSKRISEIREQERELTPTSSSGRKSSSGRASNTTEVYQLEGYEPATCFLNTWEFEDEVNRAKDEVMTQELQDLINVTQIKRTRIHTGVIPLSLKVEVTCNHILTQGNLSEMADTR